MVEIIKDRRIFSGWGSISTVDRQGDFIDVFKEFRDRGIMEIFMKRGAPVMDSHSNHPVGRIISYEYKIAPSGRDGLYLTAEIFNDYETDTNVWDAIKNKEYTGFSLGGRASEKTPICNQDGCHNILTGVENWEWSIVSTPANQEALIDNVNKLAKSHHVYKSYPITKYVQQCGNEWCVYSESGKRLGTHGSQEDAYKQLYAIEINKGFRITYSKNGKKDFIGAADKNEVNEKVKELEENGHRVLEVLDFKKGFLANVKRSVGRYFDEMGDFEIDEWVREHWRPNHHVEHDWSQTIKDTWHKKDDEYESLRHLKKAKVYVKNPNEVPQGARLEQGPKGGQYYESSAKQQAEQHGLKPYNPEQLKAKVLTDFKRRSPGQGIEKSIESEDEMKIILQETRYGLVSAGKSKYDKPEITIEEIQNRHINLKNELIKRGYVFTPVIGNYEEKIEDTFLVMMHDAEERDVIELGKAYNQDTVIVVENGHNSMIYTTGENMGKRLRGDGWQSLPPEQKSDYTKVNIKGGFFKYTLLFNWNDLLEKIMKAKVYIKNPNEAPKGVKIETGPEGGHYYESNDISGHTSGELANIERIINSPMNPFSVAYPNLSSEFEHYSEHERHLVLNNTNDINIINFFTGDPNMSVRWKAAHRADMEHLYKLVNDKEAIIRQKVAERIDQNGLHIMLHNESEPNIGVRNVIAQRINLAGLEYIIDKWDDYESQEIANKRFHYVRFLTPMVDNFNKTGKIELPEQFRNYINDTMKNNGSSVIELEATDEFYNLLDNGKYNEFHLLSKSNWEQSSSSDLALLLKDSVKRQFGGEIRYHDAVKDMQTKIQELQRKYPQELVDNYVKIQKQLTRAYLDVMFPDTDEITIYRGTTTEETKPVGVDMKANVQSNPISSWTLKQDVAKSFARGKQYHEKNIHGLVLKLQIYKDEIWSTFMSHAYGGNEREVLTIGNKDRIVDIVDFYSTPENTESGSLGEYGKL